jgi:hypothetical protein
MRPSVKWASGNVLAAGIERKFLCSRSAPRSEYMCNIFNYNV